MRNLTFEDGHWACDICGNWADEHGFLEHGKGCYTQSEDGGGTSYHEEADLEEQRKAQP